MNPSFSESDEDLLLRALEAPEGDLHAFEQLVQRYQRRILANCRHITRDTNYAEDLAQEVFVRAFFGLRRFERRSSFRHWLQRIKINHCLNYLKKQEGKKVISIDDPEVKDSEELVVPSSAEKHAERISERQQIAAILHSLPETLRLPLILRDLDEFSYEEVAETLGITLSAAKMRIKRARGEFRQKYLALFDTAAAKR